jgi:hypothetical protein
LIRPSTLSCYADGAIKLKPQYAHSPKIRKLFGVRTGSLGNGLTGQVPHRTRISDGKKGLVAASPDVSKNAYSYRSVAIY